MYLWNSCIVLFGQTLRRENSYSSLIHCITQMYRIFASVNAMAVRLSGAFTASTSSTTSQWAKLVSTVLTTWRTATDITASQPMAWNVEWSSLIGNCLDLQFKCAREIKLLSTSRITCPARAPVSTGTDCTWLVLSSFIVITFGLIIRIHHLCGNSGWYSVHGWGSPSDAMSHLTCFHFPLQIYRWKTRHPFLSFSFW